MALEVQRTVKALVERRQRERRLEAPPVLLRAVMAKAQEPPPRLEVRAVVQELAPVPLVVNPTLARLLQEMGLAPEAMLVQALLPTTIRMTRAASGPAPGARIGRRTTRRS